MATHSDPPDGTYTHWEEHYGDEPPPPPPPPPRMDFRPLFMVVDGIRRSLPQNMEEQFTALVREILLTLRALIDWYLERLDRRPAEPRVEDIPID